MSEEGQPASLLPAAAVPVVRWVLPAVLGVSGTMTAWWVASSAANALPGVTALDVVSWQVPAGSVVVLALVSCGLFIAGGPRAIVIELRAGVARLVRVLGLVPRRHRLRLFLVGLGSGVVAVGLSLLLMQVPTLASTNVDDVRDAAIAAASPAVGGLYLALHAGVSEELIYRGPVLVIAWLASRFRPALRWPITVVTVVVSAALFGAAHLEWSLANVATAAAGGLVYGAAAVACRSLWPAVVAHATVDFLIGVL